MNTKELFLYFNHVKFVPRSILDIGAHQGSISSAFKRKWPNSSIFMVEANEENEPFLKLTQIPYIITALGNISTVKPFYKPKHDPHCQGCSFYLETTPHYNEAFSVLKQIYLLDDVVKGRRFDFIKIDTQGSELDILRGGLITLSQCKYLLIEVSLEEYNKGAPLIDNSIVFLRNRKFKFVKVITLNYHNDRVIQMDMLFVNESFDGSL